MKIGLYLNNNDHKDVNLNSISLGNPGIGGSEYWAYLLAYYLTEYYKNIKFIFFTPSKLNLTKRNIDNVIVDNVLQGVQAAKNEKIDVFLINKHINVNTCDLLDLCDLIDKLKLSTITFGQNFYSKKECDLIAKSKFIKRNIFVSKQQYSIYSDLDIHMKSTYIFNFINAKNLKRRKLPSDNIVTYTGSLIGTKGFHVLARNWKNVLKECPNAKLKVIGSGKLYSRNSTLGRYGLADQDYENNFMPFLLDEAGNIHDSVEFLGLLADTAIFDVYKNTKVGVVNPSGISETFCISAIEFESMGVPVVSKKYGGLLDTIKDKETGLLFNKEKEFVSMIVKLLQDNKLNDDYSRNAYCFVRETFSAEKIIPVWYNLFQEVVNGESLHVTDSRIVRKIKKNIYSIKIGRPRLIKAESLCMPFNNYEIFSKPSECNSLTNKIFNKINIKSKLRKISEIFLDCFYGKFTGVNASKIADFEDLVFPAEKFVMPEMKDIFGEAHEHFHAYEVMIPPFYVRSFKNAYCFTNREEVFSSKKEIILEYTSQKLNPFIGEQKRILCQKGIKKIEGRVAHLSLSGLERNYYHCLTECLCRLYLIEKSKFKPDYYIISNHLSFQSDLLELLGIDKERIIPTNIDTLIQAKEIIVADFINNWEPMEFRGYQHSQKQWLPHWIAEICREKIIQKAKNSNAKKIYISRSQAKYRKIENEDEVKELFVSLGFDVYILEGMSVKEQFELFSDAVFIASIHGAGLINMMFAPSTATIFEIYPEYYHDASMRLSAKTLGLRYHYMVGKTRNIEGIHPQHENVFIDLDLLKKTLDMILV